MSDRWSDLCLWPAKAEVSPLREEADIVSPIMGCSCPPVWHGVVPPPCAVHNPQQPTITTTDTAATTGTAVARSTDPGTSWEAARSITPEKLGQDQRLVLATLVTHGPLTDERLCQIVGRLVSPSGARSRRSELVSMGLVRDSGRKDVLRSGRRGVIWEAV